MPIIRRLAPRRFDGFTLIIAAVALFGAALVLYRQSAYGVMVTADSVHYIAMARNALDGHGFMSFNGHYPALWAPLTSALYAAFGFGVFDPLAVAGPLNAATLALTVFTVGAWLRRRIESRLVVVWACLAVVFEISLVHMFDHAWSEPSFILLCTLALYWADRHLEDGKRSSLAWAAAFSALACLSRYAGVAAVVAIAGMMMLRRGIPLRERLAIVSAYSASSLAPTFAWMARNWLNTGFLTGHREVNETALEHVAPMLEEMAKWWLPYVPIPGAESAAAWVMAAAVTLTAGLGMFALFRWLRTGADAFVPLAIAFAFAHAALTLMALRTGIINMDRYVIPTYLPLLIAAAFALDRALAWTRAVRVRGRAIPAAALVAAIAAWTAFGGYVAASDARATANGDGGGRMSRAFHESETITYLRERRGADVGMTFSNQPLQAYLASDGSGLFPTPPYDWSEMVETLESRRDADGETVLAWFDDGLDMRYGAAAFHFSPGLEPLGSFQDGDVFRLKPGYEPRDPREGTLVLDSHYDVYLNNGALTWVRQPCSDEDALGMVEMGAQPVNPADADALESAGFGNFRFHQYGAKLGDLCVIRRALPDYPVKTIVTGQFIPGGEWFYRARFRMPLSDAALAYYRAAYESAAAGKLLASADFDLRLDGGDLVYLKDPCTEDDTRGRFGLSVYPMDAAHFPEDSGGGHQSMNFDFENHGVVFDGKCMARATLPEYPVRAIETGQWLPGERGLWGTGVLNLPITDAARAYHRERYAAISSREPMARSDFDVYLDGGSLAYLKEPCAESDTLGRFSLNVFPAFLDDIPESRRETGHDSFGFAFADYGVRFGDRCMARHPLPDYPIRAIETGRRIRDVGWQWKTAAAVPLSGSALAAYRDEYAAISSREPLARSDYDVYLDGGDLIYLKRPCAESDTLGRFRLSVFPANPADLPQDAAANAAHAGMNFDFFRYGATFAGACLIRRPLPDYPIRAIETGQWLPGARGLWSAKAAVGE